MKIELIERIEGEAKLHFDFKNDKIDFVQIEFFDARNIETILQNRPAKDALVINPRVCGICGIAHLLATVHALENCYPNIEISPKAKIIRELTLNFELIQNHFKWFYLSLLPLLGHKQTVFKATRPTQLMAKAIATFAGQYPHNSYSIVGGVVCDVTAGDMMQVEHYIDDTIKYFEEYLLQQSLEDTLSMQSVSSLLGSDGDLPSLLRELQTREIHTIAKSYDRFIAFGQTSFFDKGKCLKTQTIHNVSPKYITETTNAHSLAKNVFYKDRFYEVGALARAMINGIPLLKNSHKLYGDGLLTRILARMNEVALLLNHSKQLLTQIHLNEPSYIKPKIDISEMTASGTGAVEAARGSLVHQVNIKEGMISKYDIITPTQWNLACGERDSLGVAQKAMVGLADTSLAQIAFKSFDVCSVCTTH